MNSRTQLLWCPCGALVAAALIGWLRGRRELLKSIAHRADVNSTLELECMHYAGGANVDKKREFAAIRVSDAYVYVCVSMLPTILTNQSSTARPRMAAMPTVIARPPPFGAATSDVAVLRGSERMLLGLCATGMHACLAFLARQHHSLPPPNQPLNHNSHPLTHARAHPPITDIHRHAHTAHSTQHTHAHAHARARARARASTHSRTLAD
jgi:hypothetical protein